MMKQFWKTCRLCHTAAWVPAIKLNNEEKLTSTYVCDICNADVEEMKNERNNTMVTPAAQNQQVINSTFDNNDDHWDSELETVNDCSKAPEKVKVWVVPLAKVKIDALMEKYPNIEWFAYLLGDGKDKFTVQDIHVPKQTVTATSVDDIECENFNELPIIGAIHSHHGMGTGFSGTDHAFVNQNHDISLVISKTNIDGQVRYKTPCGCLKIVKAVVKPKIEVDFDKKAFLEEAVPNISKKTYNQTTYYNQAGYQPGVTPGVGQGTWANGKWVPNGRTAAQQSYTNGKSVKEIAEEAAKEKEKTGEVENDDSGNEWVAEEKSLMEALDEAFPETA